MASGTEECLFIFYIFMLRYSWIVNARGPAFFIVVVVLSHVQILTYVEDDLCTTIEGFFFSLFCYILQEVADYVDLFMYLMDSCE